MIHLVGSLQRTKNKKDTHNFNQKLIESSTTENESDKKSAHNFQKKLIESNTNSSIETSIGDPHVETLDDSESKINTNIHPVLHKLE